MDDRTLLAYDSHAATFAQDWHEQPPPTDLRDIVRRFFLPGLTAGIGCGSDREVERAAPHFKSAFAGCGHCAAHATVGNGPIAASRTARRSAARRLSFPARNKPKCG
jgi:hypothetical protein